MIFNIIIFTFTNSTTDYFIFHFVGSLGGFLRGLPLKQVCMSIHFAIAKCSTKYGTCYQYLAYIQYSTFYGFLQELTCAILSALVLCFYLTFM